MKGLKRAVLGGETFFTNTFTAVRGAAEVTLAPMLSKADGRVDWTRSAQAVHDRVRGLSPWPGSFVEQPGGPLKIHRTRLAQGQGEPGTILAHDADGPRVACGADAVTLVRLQRPGKKPVSGADFLRGTPLPVGGRL